VGQGERMGDEMEGGEKKGGEMGCKGGEGVGEGAEKRGWGRNE